MDNLFKVEQGDFPLVISVPHGGEIIPPNISLRKGGCHLLDKGLVDLGISIADSFNKNYKKSPYLVINLVSRKIFDANRDLGAAAETRVGRELWNHYHNALFGLINHALEKFGYVFLVDLHGQSTMEAVEIGYNLEPDVINNIKKFKEPKGFSLSQISKKPFDAIFGKSSLGHILYQDGFRTYPGSIRKVNSSYRKGGYILNHYTSKKGVSGVMLEIDRNSRIDITKTADRLSDSLNKFLIKNY